MRKFFSQEDVILIGHNIIRFDIPVVERLLDIKVKAKLVDTLALSWYLYPRRGSHNLEGYGVQFGVPKPFVEDWENLPIEEYIRRCEEDVKINTRLWNMCWTKLASIYDSEKKLWEFLEYLSFKMHCTRLAEQNKWKLDIPFASQALEKLETEREERMQNLAQVMPRVPVKAKRKRPVKLYNKEGELTKKGLEWYDLLAENNADFDVEEIEVVRDYNPPNPASPSQIKDWLFSLGWKPTTFKHTKDSQGNPKKIPQINLEHGKGICPSIKRLYEQEPNLEYLEGLSVLNHRIPILKGFLNTADENGYVKASVQGLTNTLRFRHAHPCVNLPKANVAYGEEVRGSLYSPEGYELCGADKSSLEDRLKQHFIYPLDPDYVNSMLSEDFDPHLIIAVLAGMLTQADADEYKRLNALEEKTPEQTKRFKEIKSVRDIAKNGNYACQYGAYPPRLMITCGIDEEAAQKLFDAYWELNWAIKTVSEQQDIKTLDDGEMWLRNPINGFYYSLRKRNDVFSTLIQGTASYVFDVWVSYVLKRTDKLIGQFHDEIILLVKEGYRDQVTEFLNKTIKQTNDQLKLNRELGIGIQFGKRYSEIH